MTQDRTEPGAGATPAPVCYRHTDRETYVSCTRCERPICPDCMRPASVGFQCPECVREGAKSVRTARTAFGGSLAGAQGMVTKALLAINVAMFVLTALAAGAVAGVDNAVRVLTGGSVDSIVYRLFAMIASPTIYDQRGTIVMGVAEGEYWRLLTAGFLHFGLIHLLFNMWALMIFGTEVERLVGRWRFLAVYLLSGVAGALAEYAFGNPHTPVAGASGSIFGLFGAVVFFFRKLNMDPRGVVLLIVLNFGLGFFIPNISILGHLGGLVVGAASGAVLAYAPRGPNRTRIQIGGLILIAAVMVAVMVWRTMQLNPF
jgi:membrane associated rhomboid family serine protease